MDSSNSSGDNNSSGSQLINTQNFKNNDQQQLNPNSVMYQYNQLKLTLENLRKFDSIEFQEEELKPGDNSQQNNLISQIKQFMKSTIQSNIEEQDKLIKKYQEKTWWDSLIENVFSIKKLPIEQISINELLDEQKGETKDQLLKRYLKDFAQAVFHLENLIESNFNLQNQNIEYFKQLNYKDQLISKLNQQIEQYQMKQQQQYQNVDEFEQELKTFQSYHEALNEDYQQSQRKIKSLENELKQLQDKNQSLVLNSQQTIEHNHILINENNNLRSQILALQVQFAQVRDLKTEHIKLENKREKLETKGDNLNQGATPFDELPPTIELNETNQDSQETQNGGIY